MPRGFIFFSSRSGLACRGRYTTRAPPNGSAETREKKEIRKEAKRKEFFPPSLLLFLPLLHHKTRPRGQKAAQRSISHGRGRWWRPRLALISREIDGAVLLLLVLHGISDQAAQKPRNQGLERRISPFFFFLFAQLFNAMWRGTLHWLTQYLPTLEFTPQSFNNLTSIHFHSLFLFLFFMILCRLG